MSELLHDVLPSDLCKGHLPPLSAEAPTEREAEGRVRGAQQEAVQIELSGGRSQSDKRHTGRW